MNELEELFALEDDLLALADQVEAGSADAVAASSIPTLLRMFGSSIAMLAHDPDDECALGRCAECSLISRAREWVNG